MTVKVNLNSVEKIQDFVSIVRNASCDCDLISGRSYLDAKSLLGILSCDISKPLQLDIHGTEEESKEIVEMIDKYVLVS